MRRTNALVGLLCLAAVVVFFGAIAACGGSSPAGPAAAEADDPAKSFKQMKAIACARAWEGADLHTDYEGNLEENTNLVILMDYIERSCR